jgi:hypothetical protein
MLKVGQELYVNESLGDVIIIDVKNDYLILLRKETGQFIKANNYNFNSYKLSWEHGNYVNNFDDVINYFLKKM